LYPIAPYYLDPPARSGLLLGYAGLAASEIDTAMRLFGASLRAV
jgi:GntR family transcriptional regulator/MocR family aminotransferase